MVASIIAYSLSGSSAKALKRLSQTPFFAQRENRVWTFFQLQTAQEDPATARPSGTSRSPLRRTGDCPHRCCAQRSGTPRKQSFNPRKLVVTQSIPSHRKPPKMKAPHESRFQRFANPLFSIEDTP